MNKLAHKKLYKAIGMPLFQNKAYTTAVEAKNCKCADIELVQDLRSGLVYNHLFDAGLMVYDDNYQNEQSLSKVFFDHVESVANIVEKNLGRKKLVEVGCGKGFFLELLQKKGFEIVGFDTAYDGKNPSISKKYFDSSSGVKGSGIILRHVLEHVENPLSFLNDIKKSNGGSGIIYIEVPCLNWIINNKAWFDICYEHVNYFRLADLKKFFGKVIDSGSFFGSGQYIYIVADLATLKQSVDISDEINFPADFLSNVPNASSKKDAELNVIWGAATKGVIFSILSGRNGFNLDYAVDINPAKQGRFLPVTALEVLSPQQLQQLNNDKINIYIMNSNYFDEIKNQTGNKYNYFKVDNC